VSRSAEGAQASVAGALRLVRATLTRFRIRAIGLARNPAPGRVNAIGTVAEMPLWRGQFIQIGSQTRYAEQR
jgi:hypothetical protein